MSRKLEFMGKKKECDTYKEKLEKKGNYAQVDKLSETTINYLRVLDPKFRKKLHTHGVFTFTHTVHK